VSTPLKFCKQLQK